MTPRPYTEMIPAHADDLASRFLLAHAREDWTDENLARVQKDRAYFEECVVKAQRYYDGMSVLSRLKEAIAYVSAKFGREAGIPTTEGEVDG